MGDIVSPESAPPGQRPRWLLVIMILATLGYVGIFAFAVVAAMMSPMVFDAGETPRAWHAFFAFLFFPVLVLISVALGWCGFSFRRYRLIPVGFALPILYCVIFWFSFS